MDSARSCVLAGACSWINIFSFAMFRAAPVIYVGIMGTYHVIRQQAAWPVYITLVIYTTAALGAGLLTRRVAVWKLTLSGCLLSSLPVSVCFFANGIPCLSFFLGVAHGCGVALLTLCNTIISQHFLRYRTVASGISNAGVTFGSFLYPPLVQFFFDEYGTRGGLLLCGGVMLNATAGALLHRLPPSPQRKRVGPLGNAAPRLNCPMNENTSRLIPQVISVKGSPNTFQDEERVACEVDDCLEEKYLTACTDVADAEAASDLLKKSDAKALRQAGEPNYRCMTVEGSLQKQHDGVSEPVPVTMNTGLMSFLWLPKFYLITVSQTQIMADVSIYISVIVDFAMDRKISKWSSVFLLLIYAKADLFARIGSGWITDKSMLKKSVMMALNFLLWGISLFLMPLCYSFYLQSLLALLAGWCNGATLIMIPVLLMEHVGLEKFSVCFGALLLLCGLSLLVIPGLIGYFRDSLGNYQGLFFLLGGLTLFTGLLCWAKAPIRKRPLDSCSQETQSLSKRQTYRQWPAMDSARSWVLAAACCWINTFSFATFRAAPVIYVGVMTTYHVTRQEAAWPLFITGVIYTATALGAGLLTRRVSVWKLTLSGCLLSSLSVAVCFFANGIPYLTFFLGVAHVTCMAGSMGGGKQLIWANKKRASKGRDTVTVLSRGAQQNRAQSE
ncbi:hypothetical protein HPB47_024106 [Ixodes persulcatus]|uniref:Uncharacterized protein n=1 Tax=Ixodes persulcatus TaxID=34615 RepID=A0AC60Q585_IXOPE|nr:hypothetical protein HPB47_024106 [Ixodes persulcatus]